MIKIQILGTGCPKCHRLAANAEAAAKAAGVPYVLEKVTDLTEILEFNVMMTPALVVDGKVRIAGKVPSPDEIRKMIGG